MNDTPQEIEKDFAKIKNKINYLILTEKKDNLDEKLFNCLDIEFNKVELIYKERKDNLNLYFVYHNYYYHKIFQFLNKDVTKAMEFYFKAIYYLLKRNEMKAINTSILEKMLKTYIVAIIKISERSEQIDFLKIENNFYEFINEFIKPSQIQNQEFISIINILFEMFIKQTISHKINNLKLTYSTVEDIEKIYSNLKNMLHFLEKNHNKQESSILSLIYENIYLLRKKQLHHLVNISFLEHDLNKKKELEKQVKIITQNMLECSVKSFKLCQKYFKLIPQDRLKNPNLQLQLVLKEIDVLASKYYYEAYSNKDIFRAWKQIDKIKHYIVNKYFKEKIPLSESLLAYFAEEWALLDIFAKTSILRVEIEKRKKLISQQWEINIFDKIINKLDIAKELFRYKLNKEQDYQLKLMTAHFSGGFSEYFIHDLFEDFLEHGVTDSQTPLDFQRLMNNIKTCGNKLNIIRGDRLELDKPDIDIHIKNKCAFFIKNGTLNSEDFSQIRREINLCANKNIEEIYYSINFVKNLREIRKIYDFFEKIKQDYLKLNLIIFDIKDVVEVFLQELKRSGKSKLNFSQLDLHKILDY